MRTFTLSTRFYETYAMAAAVQNMIDRQDEFAGLIHEFFSDDMCADLVSPYKRRSALHVFASWIIDGILYEETTEFDLQAQQEMLRCYADMPEALEELQPTRIPLEDAAQHYGIDIGSFVEWLESAGKSFADASGDDLYDWFQDLRMSGWLGDLSDRMARAVFFVVFQNRNLVCEFNQLVADHVAEVDMEQVEDKEVSALFSEPGRLARVAPPRWVQRAVFHRERGHCALCHKDVSGILSVGELGHFDHIVALARGGLNDVTNIQLLCESCNRQKSAGHAITSTRYEPWYPDEPEDD